MRRLSSRFTPVLAVILVLVFPVGLLLTVVDMLQEPGAITLYWMDYLPVLVFTVLGTFLTYLFIARIYKVELERDTLHVTRFKTCLAIPLSEVERVHSTFFFLPDFVWLPLRRPTSLGSTIAFMPWLRAPTLFRLTRHPIVEELETLASRAGRMAA